MRHEDIQVLLGAFALDAVERDEAKLVERHLEVCPRCRAELREHREVAGLLGYAGQEAPAGLWDRISASTQEPPPALRLERVRPTTDRADSPAPGNGPAAREAARRWQAVTRTRTLAVLGVAAAVVVAVLAVQVARLDHRTSTLATAMSNTAASGPTMQAVQAAMETPGARKVVLAPVSSGQTLDAVILPGGQGYVYGAKLTPLPAAQTYQLWGLTANQAVSYGLLGNSPAQVVPFRAGPGVQALAVTAEVAGGVVHSSHAPVAAGGVVPPL